MSTVDVGRTRAVRGALVAAAVFVLAAPRADAQTVNAQIDAAVERLLPSITEVRHRIHQHPELSNREFETARLVADHLRALGLEVRTGIAHTGVVALLKGGKPGRSGTSAARRMRQPTTSTS